MFNQDVIAAVKAAKFCRVVVYQVVRGWSGERVQLEVSDEISALGHTDCLRGAGHWLVIDMPTEQVVKVLRGCRAAVRTSSGRCKGVSNGFCGACQRSVQRITVGADREVSTGSDCDEDSCWCRQSSIG